MEIKITSCKDCPFKSQHTDSWDETYNICNLIRYGITSENVRTPFDYFIDFYKNGKIKSKNKLTLDNCLLLKSDLKIKYGN